MYINDVSYTNIKFQFDENLKSISNFNFKLANFITNKFTKKYDILLFINSLQFILKDDPKTIDPEFINYIKNKIINLLNPNGYIHTCSN